MTSSAMQATRVAQSEHGFGVDGVLVGVFATLLMLGLIMVFSSTIAMGNQDLSVNTSYFWRQSVHIVLGLFLAFVVSKVPLWLWQQSSGFILCIAILLLGVLLVFGVEINNSRRWFSIAGVRLQPVEFVKLAIVLYAASYLTRRQAEITKFSKGIVNMGVVLAIIGGLLLLQPDFGSFVVITATVGLMMFLGGIRIWHTLLCLTVVAAIIPVIIAASPERMNRISSFLNPWADPFGEGFQLTQALIAVGRGEVFGVGLGASIQKLYYLPHAHNDFILAVIGEELGLIGVLLVIALYVTLLHRALQISRTAELLGRVYASRLAQGVGLLLVFQAIINIGVNLGALPTKGLTLPFISYGGSSMLACCIAMGLLLGVDRQNRQRELPAPKKIGRTSTSSLAKLKNGGAV